MAKTSDIRRQQLLQQLQQSRSLIHLTTDTWHSPNNKELQAVTGHWIHEDGRLLKALLALQVMDKGHGGVEVAASISDTLAYYGIKDRLGYITSDNTVLTTSFATRWRRS